MFRFVLTAIVNRDFFVREFVFVFLVVVMTLGVENEIKDWYDYNLFCNSLENHGLPTNISL